VGGRNPSLADNARPSAPPLLAPALVKERGSAPKAWRKLSWWQGCDVGGETQLNERPVFPKTWVTPNPHLKSILAEGFLEIQKKWVYSESRSAMRANNGRG